MSLTELLAATGLTPSELIIGGGIFALALVLGAAAFLLDSGKSKTRLQRVSQVARAGAPGAPRSTVNVKRTTDDSSIAAFDYIIKRWVPNPQRMRARLLQTGYKISLGQYFLTCAFVGLVSLSSKLFLAEVPMAAAIFGAIGIGIAIPYKVIGILVKRRQTKFLALFPDAIDLIVRGLKSGLPASESIRVVSQEINDPVGADFREVTDLIKFGKTIPEALWAVAAKLELPEFRFFIIALSIQQETGGNLAETLENLGGVLRRRRTLKLKIKALSSEAKASAYIIGSLPFIMFGLILMMNYDYGSQLLTDTRGNYMIAAGLMSYAIGISIMRKMVRFEV